MSIAILNALVTWTRFDNFQQLWQHHRNTQHLLYVLGEEHHIYVGCIGGNKSTTKGITNRYQLQYLKFGSAIFGRDLSEGQVAFAGLITADVPVNCAMVQAAETDTQLRCVSEVGEGKILFRPKELVRGYAFIHVGSLPAFLKPSRDDKAA